MIIHARYILHEFITWQQTHLFEVEYSDRFTELQTRLGKSVTTCRPVILIRLISRESPQTWKTSVSIKLLLGKFRQGRPDLSLHRLLPLTTDDVINGIRRSLPDKHSAADPIPTSVLKQVGDLLAPFITELFNRSMSEGCFPSRVQGGVHHSHREEGRLGRYQR